MLTRKALADYLAVSVKSANRILPHYRVTRNCLRFALAATTAWADGRG